MKVALGRFLLLLSIAIVCFACISPAAPAKYLTIQIFPENTTVVDAVDGGYFTISAIVQNREANEQPIIYYTIDGTEPTTNSSVFSYTLIDDYYFYDWTKEVKALAVYNDNGQELSVRGEATYTVVRAFTETFTTELAANDNVITVPKGKGYCSSGMFSSYSGNSNDYAVYTFEESGSITIDTFYNKDSSLGAITLKHNNVIIDSPTGKTIQVEPNDIIVFSAIQGSQYSTSGSIHWKYGFMYN